MKKTIFLFALTAAITTSVIYSSCKENRTTVKGKPGTDNSLTATVEKGKYLATHVAGCMDCHSHRNFDKYGGPMIPGTEGMGGEKFDEKLAGVPGVVYSANITPAGIGDWTDEEVTRAITQGIRKNGDTLFPLMPYWRFDKMAKEDVLSIVAYLRTLKPIENKIPERHLYFPVSNVYPSTLNKSPDNNRKPSSEKPNEYGAYILNLAGCMDCHTPRVKGNPVVDKYLAGGFHFNHEKFSVTSANITPDSLTGIGAWNEETFLNKFRSFREHTNYNFNPGRNNTMMPWTFFAGMRDEDIKAIYAYLRTVKPVTNKVDKYENK